MEEWKDGEERSWILVTGYWSKRKREDQRTSSCAEATEDREGGGQPKKASLDAGYWMLA